MKTNVFYACKYKLIGIDGILPILMELEKRFTNINIIIIFPDEFQYFEIKKNYHIWKGLEKINAKFFVTKKGNKIITAMSLFKIALKMIFRKNIIIKNSDILPKHSQFIRFIKKLSSTKEIYAVISNQTIESYHLFRLGHGLSSLNNNKPLKINKIDFDYCISSPIKSILNSIYGLVVEKKRFFKIGYARRLPEWTAFMQRESEKLDMYSDNYFVFYLTGISGNRLGLDEPEYSELLIEALTVLKKFNKDIQTVFKPHIITAMDEFVEILDKIDYKNYIIDYAHPMIMAQKAKFAFAYTYSSTLFDAYFAGKPVILYTKYDPRLFELLNGKSEGGDACDYFIHRDPEKLDHILRKAISGDLTVSRDSAFIDENFPETSKDFWDFWKIVI